MTTTTLQQAFATSFNLILSEKVETSPGYNEFKEVARVKVPYPTLVDFGITDAVVAINTETKQPEVSDDGTPVYENDIYDWLQSAILAQIKAQTRNKFVKGVLKPDAKLSTNFEELVAVSERSGEALKARHEARRSFMTYLEAKGKNATVVKLLGSLFGDAASISVAKDDYVDALKAHSIGWVTGLNETDKVRYTRTIQSLQEAIQGRNVSMEDLK